MLHGAEDLGRRSTSLFKDNRMRSSSAAAQSPEEAESHSHSRAVFSSSSRGVSSSKSIWMSHVHDDPRLVLL